MVLLSLAAVFVIAGGLFVWQERRAREPIISIGLWSQKLVAISNLATVFAGMVFIGVTTVLPLYVQGVMGWSTVIAGFTLTALVIGWPLSIMVSAQIFRRFGIRATLRYGSLLLPVGAAFLVFTQPGSSPVLPGIGAFLMGAAMGIISFTTVALVQDSVEWRDRGSATALGAVLNAGIAYFATGELAAVMHDVLNTPTGLANLATNPEGRAVFDLSLHWTFYAVVVIAALTAVFSFLVPIRPGFDSFAPSRRAVNDAIVPVGDIEG